MVMCVCLWSVVFGGKVIKADHTATANVDVDSIWRSPRGAWPLSGPPSLHRYRPTSALEALMWSGRTWRGRAGPKVISRTVTSENHFPTIKEGDKLSGPNIGRFHGIRSNICICVCLSVDVTCTVPPNHNHSQTLLSRPTVTERFQMCLRWEKTTRHQNEPLQQRRRIN